ncbi:GyrI-like domain-containing protein [Gillisia hiemivivida]|uniref:GyrI-like domain-containing protein n=1 Tax=Gillisia hiemivivida TaxID=291190 RepID=A0A5C6ZWN4_9FLAO|nr:GyrI-like domain-containing protein [Gillisia hiemivivida]TXD93674.1 GyrI-like domain-containing protein [Gillisia hiemivivida]
MYLIPRIENISKIKLIGKRMNMTFSNLQTQNLWKSFMPRRKQIANVLENKLFSVEVYNTANFFEDFDPRLEFEKWAAVEVSDFDTIPSELEILIIPSGKYAVFKYIGRGSEASEAYRNIIQDWFPTSEYKLDHRPHFAVMGEKYKNEDPTSEEELWFPIKAK